ncbi:hypothetical protein SKAU_G00331980 [Synaphobranchus kaupii]|uniref:Ig-like domain-containing protein n=1 Tax=Synaphobranchus kaupii TaxID=118154 RepID=A0A9Q1IIC8_SYNKA|nr:hypothetical protein SKAU_G00331980 [Synaphobranchus kaupii]
MIRHLSAFTIILYSLTGLSFGNSVHQSPSTLLNHTGESVQLSCSHNIPNYDTILWYHQPQQGNGMKLIGRVSYKNVELEGEKRFNMNCSHNLGGTYFQMYWYKQNSPEGIRLIVFTTLGTSPEFGNFSKGRYVAEKTVAERGSLTVKKLEAEDGGAYFCAVKEHGSADSLPG